MEESLSRFEAYIQVLQPSLEPRNVSLGISSRGRVLDTEFPDFGRELNNSDDTSGKPYGLSHGV